MTIEKLGHLAVTDAFGFIDNQNKSGIDIQFNYY